MTALVSARSLSYAIGGKTLVDDVSLDLEAGLLTAILGPNGAGKTTLLRMLTGELKPTIGSVRMGDETLHTIPAWRLATRRAVMTQATSVTFPFTCYEVVRIAMQSPRRKAASASAMDDTVVEAMAVADVLHLADRFYHTLSGGEQQRVQFARAVCQLKSSAQFGMPQVLYLDEPTSNLDLRHQLMLIAAARTLATAGLAVCAILHDVNLACSHVDRIVMMKSGRAVASGRPAAIVDRSTVRNVFDVDILVCEPPPAGTPYVLPFTQRPG
ncbi:heme ABC transporter ATP-binding protein [Roseiarcaceae bacterium H3SJ34-1]|uniref:heme ABC transporter ATP-binding protein n=1 Tax=Terripilifer ovatus TaxID=3032367 RepID=UPI003AB94174|nr:heme ABC transporter ATP-binding protein [Roseiarcaceae bacterium H3SJ34-1]